MQLSPGSNPVATRPGLATTFRPFRTSPGFRSLWISSITFFTAAWIQSLVLGWLAYTLTGSAFLLAVYTSVSFAPMLLGPLGGLLAERFDRVWLIVITQAFSAAVTLVLALLSATGVLSYWMLLVGGFCLGISQFPTNPARTTLAMDLVERRDLSGAVALNFIPMNGTLLIGPAIGGILLDRLGATSSLLMSAAWYAVAIVLILPLLSIPRPHAPHVSGSPFRQLAIGMRAVLTHRLMLTVLSITFSANFFVWPAFRTFLPVFAKDVLDVGASGLGVLQTLAGLGTVTGSLIIAGMGDFKGKGRLFLWGTLGFGLAFAVFGISRSFPLSLAALALTGLCSSAFSAMQSTLLLVIAPPEVRAHAMGVMTLAIGVLPIAAFCQGVVSSVIGVPLTAILSGLALAIAAVLVMVRAPALRRA